MIRHTELMRTPHDTPPDWMAVITAYIDESGYGSKEIIVLGGFVGNDDQWTLCATAWKVGLQRKKALHMKEQWWKKPNRIKPLLERLGKIPHSCGLLPV